MHDLKALPLPTPTLIRLQKELRPKTGDPFGGAISNTYCGTLLKIERGPKGQKPMRKSKRFELGQVADCKVLLKP
jgi:hypothetical protein